MTLSDFFNLPCARNAHTISALTDFSKRIITGITIQEYPIENFVRPNELVLSTALIVRDNSDMMHDFINAVKNSGATALLLAFPNDINCLSKEINDYIASDNFPIMLLPWNQPFADVIKEVTKSIWSTEDSLRIQLESLQNQLLTSYLNNKNLSDAANIIASNLFCNVVITDSNHEEKAYGTYINSRKKKSDKVLTIELSTPDIQYGFMELFDFDESLFLEHNQIMIEQYTTTALTLWFNKEWIVSSVQMQIKDNFIKKLSNNEYNSNLEILSNAEDLGFNTACNYRCIVGQFLNRKEYINNNWTTTILDQKRLNTASSKIKEQVLLAASKQNLHVMTTYIDSILIIYLECDTSDNVCDFLDLVDNYFSTIISDYICAWGYDLQASPITEIGNNTKNARSALDTVFHAKPTSLRSSFQTSKSQRLMSLIASVPKTRSLAEEILAPVIDYDKHHSSELMQTITCFCSCNGHINETARTINLHRQSLLYRIDKIEELLGVDLKKHHDYYLIDSCIQILNWNN